MKLKLLILVLSFQGFAQEKNNEFTFNEFLGYVKKFHPIAKTAQLEVSKAQANLMAARGAFDPKIEVDFSKKEFKDKNYYSLLNSSFKIPTWYGVELKAGLENNEGYYLDPQNATPAPGLAAFGINVALGQGMLINQRMADLRKAKIQINLSQSERMIQATNVLYDAAVAYFNWKKNYSEYVLYKNYLTNAQNRFKGIQSLIQQGDKPAIDSIEAAINVKNRQLSLVESELKLTKSKLELSNFLWFENNIPLELNDQLIPEVNLEASIQQSLGTLEFSTTEIALETHPKINAIQNKIAFLTVDQQLKANLLLPKIELGYSYLSEPKSATFNRFEDYKFGVNFYFPLFLRKERGNLKLARFKKQETEWQLELEKLQLKNKFSSLKAELLAVNQQKTLIKELATANATMLSSEERLFALGESSLFLINSRENNLVSAQLAQLAIENRWFVSNADLFKAKSNPEGK